jgi:2-dehydropantoate 2-reductase
MKVCIVGAGAIGGYLGMQMARAGVDVSLVARGPHLAAMRENGLRLLIGGDEQVARIPCSENAAGFGRQDYVFITLKAHSISAAVPSMLPLLGDATTVVTASNGLPYWFFAVPGVECRGLTLASVDPDRVQLAQLGAERAVGCVVFPATEMVAPGVIRHEHGGKFPIGEPSGTVTPRIERLGELMTASGFDAPIRTDIRDELWLKLWGNLCFNPVSALTGATIDMIATNPGTRAVLLAMMEEARAIGDRLGLRLRVNAERRLAGAAALGPHRMSMLQDLERGRAMEVDALVGVVKELGQVTDVPTPAIDTVYALIDLRARIARPGPLI